MFLGTYFESASTAYEDDIDGIAWVTFDKASGTSGTATPRIFVGVADVGQSVFKSEDGGVTCKQLFATSRGCD